MNFVYEEKFVITSFIVDEIIYGYSSIKLKSNCK